MDSTIRTFASSVTTILAAGLLGFTAQTAMADGGGGGQEQFCLLDSFCGRVSCGTPVNQCQCCPIGGGQYKCKPDDCYEDVQIF